MKRPLMPSWTSSIEQYKSTLAVTTALVHVNLTSHCRLELLVVLQLYYEDQAVVLEYYWPCFNPVTLNNLKTSCLS